MDSVPGVGLALRSSMLAWLHELGKLNQVEVAKLAGVAPLNQDSGKLRGQQHIAGGRAPLRKAVHGHNGSDAAQSFICGPTTTACATMASCTRSPWLRPCASSR